jgi:hypothetical protein
MPDTPVRFNLIDSNIPINDDICSVADLAQAICNPDNTRSPHQPFVDIARRINVTTAEKFSAGIQPSAANVAAGIDLYRQATGDTSAIDEPLAQWLGMYHQAANDVLG